MIFFSSDHHFGHSNIIKYATRPFKNVDEMNQTLVENWNNTVKPEDTVYYLGDFSFYHNDSFRQALNGDIIFVKGNHDKSKLTVTTNITLRIDGHSYFLTHRPEDSELLMVTLCGHVHGLFKHTTGKAGFPIINVGVDVWDFKPVSFDELKSYLMSIGYRGEI